MLLRALSIMVTASLFLAIAPGLAVSQDVVNPNAEKLMNPALLNEKAPETFQVKFDTTKGEFILDVTRAWAPNGADRFYNLVKNGFFNDSGFFRVVENFMVQFGVSNDPKVSRALMRATITDDPVKQSNKRGYITFAMGGPNTRTTQVFISYIDNSRLDSMGFAPFGKVTKGMNVVDSIYSGYGDMPSQGGSGPDPNQIIVQGNAYLHKAFSKLDYIKSATIVQAK
jgi:peptidyl-prolyl cis-trans isomerase A (cyclophilin A)